MSAPPVPPALEDRALKTLFRVLVAEAGGLDAAAACVRVGRSRLAEYYALDGDAFAPVDVVARLEAIVGRPLVTAELARRAGCALEPLGGGALGRIDVLLARVGAEVGQVNAAYAEALADGGLCAADRARLAREAAEARNALDALLGALQAEGR